MLKTKTKKKKKMPKINKVLWHVLVLLVLPCTLSTLRYTAPFWWRVEICQNHFKSVLNKNLIIPPGKNSDKAKKKPALVCNKTEMALGLNLNLKANTKCTLFVRLNCALLFNEREWMSVIVSSDGVWPMLTCGLTTDTIHNFRPAYQFLFLFLWHFTYMSLSCCWLIGI